MSSFSRSSSRDLRQTKTNLREKMRRILPWQNRCGYGMGGYGQTPYGAGYSGATFDAVPFGAGPFGA